MALTDLTIVEAKKQLASKKISATELTKAYLQAVEKARPLNVYVTETPEVALKQAALADQHYAAGTARPLEGMPLGIKDLFCTKDIKTTVCSKILHNFVPTYESTVTQKLWDAGAVCLGKLGMDEFAMGASNQTSAYGNVINPWGVAKRLIPGGSSGGSAAAVAARACMAATGSDTGGSCRQPASYCGVVGFKPTYGRCSRWGMVAFASSLDQAGMLTRDVADAAATLQIIAGHDPKDSTSAPVAVPNFSAGLGQSVKGLRVGIPKEYYLDGMAAETVALWQQGIAWFKDAGAEIVEVELPHTKYAMPTYYIIAPAEASSNLARYDGVRFGLRVDGSTLDEMYEKTRGEGFGKEVRRRIIIGTYALSAGYYDAYYTRAQKVRALIALDFERAYKKCDVLLCPTSPGVAFPAGEKMDDPIKMYLEDIFTSAANLAGLPAISVPAGLNKDKLPQGLQIMANRFDEVTMFKAAAVIEKQAAFTHKPEFCA